MHLDIVGLQIQRLLIPQDGLCISVQTMEYISQVYYRGYIISLEHKGCLVRLNRLLQALEPGVGIAQLSMNCRIIGGNSDGLIKMLNGRFGALQFIEH